MQLSNIKPDTVVWLRYVDDILWCWPIHSGTDLFLTRLYNFAQSVKFIVEEESNNSLPLMGA